MTVRARLVFEGSDGEATKRYYALLQERGPIGFVAMNLFRAQKCSTRAKLYRGSGYKQQAYERKSWSIGLLVAALAEHGPSIGVTFGWGNDPEVYEGHRHVLYVELPQGQISFHNDTRHPGPDFKGEWDGQRGMSPVRIMQFCDAVMGLNPEPATTFPALPPRNFKHRTRFNKERKAQLQRDLLKG